MATIQKYFDVKINVIFPHISKTIPDKDSERIQTTNFFKYEAQKAVQQPDLSIFSPVEEDETQSNEDRVKGIDAELEVMEDDFKRLEDRADVAFKDYVFVYDVTDPAFEQLKEAEEAIFGVATGRITQDKFTKVLDLIDVIDEVVIDATIENRGELNVVGA